MENIYDNESFFAEYAKMDRSRRGLDGAGEWHQLQPLLPPLRGLSVLDLGCGYGWHCRYAAAQGAERVLGIDGSRRMIAEAERLCSAPQVRYRVCALEEYSYPAAEYDLVLSNLVLHYVRDLEAVYRDVFRTLRAGGVFLFNIEHPVFTAGVHQEWVRDGGGRPLYWPVDRYFSPGRRDTVFLGRQVAKEHHTLTQILMGLRRAGFLLDAVEEAVPPEELRELPSMAGEMDRPMMLLVRAVKPADGPAGPAAQNSPCQTGADGLK